jgi:hypothetical protein
VGVPGFHAECALGSVTQRYVPNIAWLALSFQTSGSSQVQVRWVLTALGRGGGCGSGVCCGGRVDGEGLCVGDCCPRSRSCCGDTCSDLQTDPNNCGKCIHTCASGICRAGQCGGCTDPAKPHACGGMCCPPGQCGSNGVCCHTDAGEAGCFGRCCPSGQDCWGGVHCPSGQTGCNGTCVQMGNDPHNYGSCGNVCTGGMTCQGGTCACSSPLTDCGGTCVSLRDNQSNCGSCGRACPSGWMCQDGQCVLFQAFPCTKVCEPNTSQCLTKCCRKWTGECTGWNGRRCIVEEGISQCCQGGPFWGEQPWIQICDNISSPGGVPNTTVQQNFNIC